METKSRNMNTIPRFNPLLGSLLVMALMTAGTATTVAQDGKISSRSLSRREISEYNLAPDTRLSGGLYNVGLGQPVYLEALVDIGIPATNIVGDVVWEIAAQPVESMMTGLEPSPITTNVPIFSSGDQDFYQLAFPRAMLVPTNTGEFTITATIITTTTNIVLVQNIQCATYMGWQSCQLCHSGGFLPDKAGPWATTGHSMAFSEAIDGISTDHFAEYCISCHAVGDDMHPLAVNDGFDDRALADGWVFPTNHVPGTWESMMTNYPDVAEAANVQCENCHGAGSEHAFSLGDPSTITVSFSAGDCGQCHDAPGYHVKNDEWSNSKHSIATTRPTGEGRSSCVRCHSGIGFVDYIDGNSPLRLDYEAITCAACHDPHTQMVDTNTVPPSVVVNPHILRTLEDVTLNDVSKPGGPTVIAEGGKGKICMNCHMGRRDTLTYVKPGAGSSHFGPHHGPQTDMLAGANAWTYGQDIPSSSHLAAIGDSCVTCHLQENTSGDTNSVAHVGGHTFRPRWDAGTPEDHSDDVDLVAGCVDCHGQITTFNFPKQDYNGDGVIEGVQTEVEHMINELGMLLPPEGSPDVAIAKSWTEQQLQAGFNWEFVHEDGSLGVHNVSYAVGLLRASIADLTDDANRDGLPDTWQTQYFGDINNPDAAPNAAPSGDGIPNSVKYNLGINPLQPGAVLPDGVMWANATSEDNTGTPLRIYTAAEIAIDTELGITYQIQSMSSLVGSAWEDFGTAIPGTGKVVSLMTPTRHDAQQYFRVVEITSP